MFDESFQQRMKNLCEEYGIEKFIFSAIDNEQTRCNYDSGHSPFQLLNLAYWMWNIYDAHIQSERLSIIAKQLKEDKIAEDNTLQ